MLEMSMHRGARAGDPCRSTPAAARPGSARGTRSTRRAPWGVGGRPSRSGSDRAINAPLESPAVALLALPSTTSFLQPSGSRTRRGGAAPSRSNRAISPSSRPTRRWRPPPRKTTEATAEPPTLSRRRARPPLGFPDDDRPLPVPRGQAIARGVECQGPHLGLMAGESLPLGAVFRVQEANEVSILEICSRTACDERAVRAECQPLFPMIGHTATQPTGVVGTPNDQGVIVGGGGDPG